MHVILTADIGGTHCRFGLFHAEQDQLTFERQVWRPTAGLVNTDGVLDACAEGLAVSLHEADTLSIAIAGPILNPLQAHTTNAALSLDLRTAGARHGLKSCCIINDFTAQAFACLTEAGTSARRILPVGDVSGTVPASATKGVLGAGTGFGTASLVCDSVGDWLALPAEGGHMGFPFVGEEETALQQFVMQEQKRASPDRARVQVSQGRLSPVVCDDILSGYGLRLLHRFLTGEDLSPAEVGRVALGQDSATLRFFARLYGRMCRYWAFATLCQGGLYIAGGIAAKNPCTVTCPAFAEEFYRSDYLGSWLRELPLFLVDCENSGLWGAARYGLGKMKRGGSTLFTPQK